MPVTAKLSQRFYQRFGDELTNELVDWFNAVDATYRSDLRDLNENNFARFDAKLQQRFAETDVKVERRFAALEARVDSMEVRFDSRMDRGFAEQREWLTERLSRFETRMNRWMLALWTSTMISMAAVIIAALRPR
jgi:hypothetical protein